MRYITSAINGVMMHPILALAEVMPRARPLVVVG